MFSENGIGSNFSKLFEEPFFANTSPSFDNQPGDQVVVNACGRTCQIDVSCTTSIAKLQEALQRTLGMEGQTFQVCDIDGTPLLTDYQVRDAVMQGLTPLGAVIPDEELHSLENRREELSQMQWKVVRDQLTQGANQFTQLSKQIRELQMQIDAIQRDSQASFLQMQRDMVLALDKEGNGVQSELHTMQESVNGMMLLVNGERNNRELVVQGFEQHFQGVWDTIDDERSGRRQDTLNSMSIIRELQGLVETERAAREAIEESVREVKMQVGQFREDVGASIQASHDHMRRTQADASLSVAEALSRLAGVEEQCTNLETSLHDSNTFSNEAVRKLSERFERASQTLEALRLSCRQLESSTEGNAARSKDLEALVQQHGVDVRNLLQQEKTVREDGLRCVQQSVLNDYKKHIADLEKRLTVRLEKESAERERNFKVMMDEVVKIVDSRRIFRDHTITKTVRIADACSFPQSPPVACKRSPSSEQDRSSHYSSRVHEKALVDAATNSNRVVQDEAHLLSSSMPALPVRSSSFVPSVVRDSSGLQRALSVGLSRNPSESCVSYSMQQPALISSSSQISLGGSLQASYESPRAASTSDQATALASKMPTWGAVPNLHANPLVIGTSLAHPHAAWPS